MEPIIYGKPILNSVLTLKTLMKNFEPYTKEQDYSGDETNQYEEVVQTMDLLQGSMAQIALAKSSLENLVEKMKLEYDSRKNKEEKKQLLQHMEDTEKDTKFTDVLKEATEFYFMLSTRRTEANSKRKKLARKLGIAIPAENTANDPLRTRNQSNASNADLSVTSWQEVQDQQNSTGTTAPTQGAETSTQQITSVPTIPPPRVNLPQFFGNEAEWPEFWAIYNTLVHSNPTLSTIEKMILLKDSLRGKSDRAVKRIQLIPQNYNWMVETLQKKYGNKTANRARIVQQLNALQQANDSAESSEYTYDRICTLLNQMVSTGQDIRSTKDAMWTEAILRKFPHTIIEPVLVKMKDRDDTTIDDLMTMIDNEIAAKSYIESRTPKRNKKSENSPRTPASSTRTAEKQVNSMHCVLCGKQSHPPWQCQAPIPTVDKRRIMLEKRLCWKSYSNRHSSKECMRGNCPLCGQLHDKNLCFSSTGVNTSAVDAQLNGQRSELQQHSAHPNAPQINNNRRVSYTSRNTRESRQPELTQQRNTPTRTERRKTEVPEVTQNHTNVDCNSIKPNNEQIVLMTAEGSVWNANSEKYEKAIFFFDTGAQKTVIQEDFARRLGLPSLKTETCIMSGIGGKTETFESGIVHLKVGTAFGKDLQILIQTKPILTRGFPSVKLSSVDQEFLQKQHLLVCNPSIRDEHQVPHIIVGLDHYYSFVLDNGEAVLTPSGLRLAKTVFGPTLYGRGIIDASIHESPANVTVIHGLTAITERTLLNRIFELDGMGISSDEILESQEFVDYFKKYSEQISFDNGYVTAPFPLKPNIVDLTDNFSAAIRRLMSLHLQLEKNPVQKEWYCKIMRQYETDDIIERASYPIPNSVGLCYMPHSGVWRSHKPKPLRIVFDASSKKKGHLSLNDVTLKGESLVNKIHDILIASRTSKIIMTCDIEAAFTQIRLLDTHKDLCRFLWLKDPDQPPTRDNVVEYRFKRVPFGAKPSPSILNMCLLAFLRSRRSSLAKGILDNLYVDNILLRADTPDEAIAKYKESKALFAEIGMNLREYISNCDLVNTRISERDRAPSGTIRLLGVKYDIKTDRFQLNLTFKETATLTKKDIVSQLNSIYDPIGIAGPLTITLKRLMREIYDSGIEWKAPVTENLASKWREACTILHNTSISIPRFANVFAENASLWVFADASAKALAACAFVCGEQSKEVTQLISGKTRLTPKKTRQTIPRLETLAILMAIRLARTIATASKTKFDSFNF